MSERAGNGCTRVARRREGRFEPRRTRRTRRFLISALRAIDSSSCPSCPSWRIKFFRLSLRRTTSGIGSNPLPIELRLAAGPEELQRAALADRVGPAEDPVLPGRESAEDFGLHRLGADEAQAGFHAG